MALNNSAKKRIRQDSRKRDRNLSALNSFRSSVKDFEKKASSLKPEEANILLSKVNSLAGKALKKGILKKRTASRRISSLNKQIKSKI